MAKPYFSTNTIYCGDCELVLANFPDECVDLIYADPPFFSNQQYEIIWGDGYEIRAFEDRWKGGINNYVEWMVPKIEQCQRVLKKTGSMYLHCDWHAGHYLKVECDRIFGYKNFRNEVVWYYRRWPTGKQQFQRNHDTIFFYTKSDKGIHTFNSQYVKPTPETLKRWGTQRQRVTFNKKGKRNPTQELKEKSKGVLMPDVWNISIIAPVAKERLGFPTQKPMALLERVITASSNPMDIVLDPFCGCGTSIAVAHKLGRRWLGVDVSPTACDLMQKRMKKLGAKINMMGMPLTEEDLRKVAPFEFQNWVVRRLYGRVAKRKSGDMGIDGTTFDGTPIQVKQSDYVGRNVVDNFETAIRRRKKTKGIIVAFSFGRGAYEEIARAKLRESLDIKALSIKEILKNQEQQLI